MPKTAVNLAISRGWWWVVRGSNSRHLRCKRANNPSKPLQINNKGFPTKSPFSPKTREQSVNLGTLFRGQKATFFKALSGPFSAQCGAPERTTRLVRFQWLAVENTACFRDRISIAYSAFWKPHPLIRSLKSGLSIQGPFVSLFPQIRENHAQTPDFALVGLMQTRGAG